jgi:hypothetical protein
VESNPFLHLVAQSKLRALQAPPTDFESLVQRVAALAIDRRFSSPTPALSTFSREDYLQPAFLDELLHIKGAITHEAATGATSELAIDLAQVCLAAAIEPATMLRKDGRALRYEKAKDPIRPLSTFMQRAEAIVEDLPSRPSNISGSVDLGDTRKGAPAADPFDLILFSPPYPNNIDYTEVYKLELWLLGFVNTAAEFADQRRRTVRSHASLKFSDAPDLHPGVNRDDVDDLISPVVSAIPAANRYASSRRRIVEQYLLDMYSSFLYLKQSLKRDGRLVYIVGNSLHGSPSSGSVLIASEVLLAALAERSGLVIDQIVVARVPSRRASKSPFLRESVVYAHKADD